MIYILPVNMYVSDTAEQLKNKFDYVVPITKIRNNLSTKSNINVPLCILIIMCSGLFNSMHWVLSIV